MGRAGYHASQDSLPIFKRCLNLFGGCGTAWQVCHASHYFVRHISTDSYLTERKRNLSATCKR